MFYPLLRASFGVINTDRLPLDDDSEVTNYWEQTYGGGGYYPFDTNYSVEIGRASCRERV